METVTKGHDSHLSTLDICEEIEIENRKEYPKHEHQKLKMEKILHGPIFYPAENHNSSTIFKEH
jgi:hypothetical protein